MIANPSALKTQEQDVLIALKCLPSKDKTQALLLAQKKPVPVLAYVGAFLVFVAVSVWIAWLAGTLLSQESVASFLARPTLLSAILGISLTAVLGAVMLGVPVVVYSFVSSRLPHLSHPSALNTKEHDRARDLMSQALPTLENDDLKNEILKAMLRLEDPGIEEKFWKEVVQSLEGYFKIKTNNYGLGF